jgi:plasmid stabilization system protein ParE
MSLTVRYHDLAELELRDAAKYYESEYQGLGEAFLSEIDYAVNQIREYPEAAPIILDVVRKKVIRRFPYSIMYVFDAEGVTILAIANQHRRPFYWGNRE